MRRLQIADLALTPVDANSPVPLYHQIESDLRKLIETGVIAPDDILPPENELCRVYGVGRHTVRMALSRLVNDRLIVRKSGRGTVVVAGPDRTRFYLDRSFTRQMADFGLTARSVLLETSAGAVDARAPEPLRSHIGARCLHIARLRLGDGDPVGLQYTTLLTDHCPGIETVDFTRESLYDVLHNQYRMVIARISHVVSAAAADRTQASLLQVTPGEPLLVVKTTAHLTNNDVIEYTMSYYRTDKYEYSTTYTFGS
ncbi:MAG: GntR family transcriptional regulator [Anaerolineae bacterium]|nr:GntR family transcriptional regulator [Anaerolineae bacterium]